VNVVVVGILMAVRHPGGPVESHLAAERIGGFAPLLLGQLLILAQRK
jgi:hypothetical protein